MGNMHYKDWTHQPCQAGSLHGQVSRPLTGHQDRACLCAVAAALATQACLPAWTMPNPGALPHTLTISLSSA